MSHLKKFLTDPYKFSQDNTIVAMVNLAKKADKAYYDTDMPLMSDQQYDLLREFITLEDPNHPYLNATGASVNEKVKVDLPYHLGSMTKPNAKDIEKFIIKFKSQYPGPYMISSKLDGVSGLLYMNIGGDKLYTKGRSDENAGTDITNLLEIIDIDYHGKKYPIRGEIIMSNENFQEFKDIDAHPRNTVAGIVNSKTINVEKAQSTTFVGYEVIDPWLPFDKQMKIMESIGLNVVKHELIDDFTLETLVELYREHTIDSEFECDGIIVSQNSPLKRNIDGNPKYAFAFKNMDDLETTDVTVTKIVWQISKDGYINPVINFKPVLLAGVQVKRATAFNAKYIYDNCLGPGSVITIVRSGGVIPYIKHIVKKSKVPQMPDIDYVWNTTNVDIITSEYSDDQKAKELDKFCSVLKIKGVALASIKKFIDADIDTVSKIVSVTKDDLSKVTSFKQTMINKIYNIIQERIQLVTLQELMVATNIFGHGFGIRLIKKIFNDHPDIIFKYIEMNEDSFYELLMNIDGFADERSTQFQSNMMAFLDILDEMPEELQDRLLFAYQDDKETKKSNNNLSGKKFVFSSFRDKEWEELLEEQGATTSTSVSSKTYAVVANQSDIDAGTNKKIKDAIKHGCLILSKESFKEQYL